MRFELQEEIRPGITKLDHYRSVIRQGGTVELNLPDIPPMAEYLYEWFVELSQGRGEGGLTYTNIKAWADMNQIVLNSTELKIIKELDMVYIQQQNKQIESKTNR